MRIGMEQPAQRLLMLYPRRFFGSVCAWFPVVATSRFNSVSTRLLKVRFCSRAIACSCSRKSRSMRTLRGTLSIVATLLLCYDCSMVTRLKAYKFRFYPTAAQRQQLAVEFGNARFVFLVAFDL